MYERKMPIKKRSGLDITFFLVGGKWKRDIILGLVNGIRRPSHLQKHLAGASVNPRVLRQQLRELERFGIIDRTVAPGITLKVEYFLTEIGWELVPLFHQLNEWGRKYEEAFPDLEQKQIFRV